MFKVSDSYKNEIGKLGGRCFVSKVVIRDTEYNDDNIIDMSLNESVNPGDNFSLGSVASNTFEINLIDVDNNVIFEEAIVKPYIGLELDNKIEYIPLGVFTVDDVAIKDKKVKLECVDNMIKLERAYFSDLKYPVNINEVLKEICKKSNISCKSVLPNYSIDEIKGYSFRQAIGIIATLVGCFARFNRIGELEIISYEDTDLRITPDTFFKFETNDKDYIVGKITAKKGEKIFSKGSNTEIIIDNPVITENIVNDLYNKFKDFTYRPYTLSWQGNPAVQAGDRVTIVDLDGKEYNTLIMEQKFTYNGGIKSELKASGKTESSDKFDSKGSITQAMENYSIEQAAIKVALIKKADIDSLNAIDARINNLYAQDLTVLNAKIRDLQSTKISTIEFNALEAKLQHALIGKANVNELNVAVERVGILEGKTLSVENQLAGNLTAKNFKANSITAGSGIIAEGAIGSAQISDLELNKLRAGDISTSKFRIISANGSIQIVGNQLLVNRDNINRVVLGEYRKQDNTTDYGLLIRAKDGKTIMLDSEGVHNAGITDGAINNNKVADNANISGNKLDINSVIREVNNKGTETIKGTKVTVGDRTLDVELSTQNNTITEHSKELSSQKASIQALDNELKFKVDNQTFTQSTETIKGNINSLNSDLVNKINTGLNSAKSYADYKKQEAINTASTDATNKANNALNSAKEFTTAQITTTNSNLCKATSEINILKEQINTKVGQVDIDKSIQDIKFNDVNMLFNSANFKNTSHWSITNGSENLFVENNYLVAKFKNYANWGCYVTNDSLKNIPLDTSKKYTVVCRLKVSKNQSVGFNICDGNSYNHVYSRDLNITTDWQIFKFTFKPSQKGNERQFRFITSNLGYEFDLYIEFVKMVEGATSSDVWTSNPLEVNQTIVDNIKIVTDKINDVSTKLVQAKDSLQASVNSLNSTTQTITTNLTNTTNDLSNKINTAKTDAINSSKSYADTKKNEAITSANSHADSVATTKANAAQSNAIAHADNVATIKSNEAKSEAISSANSYTNSAKQQAIDSANSHANSVAEQKKNQAIVDARTIPDTRNNDQVPDWYIKNYPRQTITEFKFANVIKIPNSSSVFGTLETKTPWDNYSGGYPTQVFRSNSYPTYQRHGISGTAWSEWEQIEDTQGSQSKADSALNNAKTYTNAQITTVNTRVSNAESSINVLKNQISTKVSQSDIDKTVNNIKIGIRNLLRDSSFIYNSKYWSPWKYKMENGVNMSINYWNHKDQNGYIPPGVDAIVIRATNCNNGEYGIISELINVKSNTEYTLSWYSCAHRVNQQNMIIRNEGGAWLHNWFSVPHFNNSGNDLKNWGEPYVYTFNTGNNTKIKVNFVGNIFENDGYLWFCRPMLVEGNKVVDWSTTPEDIGEEIKDNITTVTEKINTVESTLTQKTNNINATVSSVQSILNTKADGSTVSSMQSQLSSLNIGLNGIKLEVANKTDKGSIISAINQSAEEIKINASKIQLNGITTFSDNTGLKAVEISNNAVKIFNWNQNGDYIGCLTANVLTKDKSKPIINLANRKNSMLSIGYTEDDHNFKNYIEFDKYKLLNKQPIKFCEEMNLGGNFCWLGPSNRNVMYESSSENFCIKTAHGLKIMDIDTGHYTADLGANSVSFGKWNNNYYYASFFPGGFNLNSGDGTSYFWVNAGSSDICTKVGVNLKVQGNLTVRGSKNRVVETVYGDLKLNAVESTECWFTDMLIEQSRTDSNGDCIIWFDNKFLQTVNTSYKYKVDVTPIGEFASNGKLTYVRVVEKTEKYFKVRGTPNTLFDWTITAKQKGYERDRLEKAS